MKAVKRNICLIIPGMDAGGIENYVLRYLHYADDASLVTVMSRSLAKGDLLKEYEKTGTKLHWQQVSYMNLYKWFRLFLFFRKNRFTTVCDFNENFAGIPMLLAAIAGVGKRVTFYRRSSHAFNPKWYRMAYAKLMNFLVFTYSTTILSNSKHAFDFFFGEEKSTDPRFKVIQNGVDASVFDVPVTKAEARKKIGLPDDVFIIGHSGRYDSAKNHKTWFKVAEVLMKKYSNVRFLFCGKGTDSKDFLEQLKKHNIEEVTYCIGLTDDVPLMLRTMDLFYFPSITEGQPNALIEAILSGVPILASNIKPIKEVIPMTYHDKLIDPLNVTQAIAGIEDHYSGRSLYKQDALKSWAVDKFGSNKNFKIFDNELK